METWLFFILRETTLMADIISTPGKKRLSTRVDLTPMVDLGFLLITFFIFTTTMSEATGMKLTLPKDSPDSSKTSASKTLNLILAGGNKIWYYRGDDLQKVALTDYNGLRSVITNMRSSVQQQFKDPKETVVLIKPTPSSSYKNLVDTWDEMTICDISRPVLMEPSVEEKGIAVKNQP